MADFYERAFLNGILGNQNVINGTTADMEYMLPFGDAAQSKPFAPVGRKKRQNNYPKQPKTTQNNSERGWLP